MALPEALVTLVRFCGFLDLLGACLKGGTLSIVDLGPLEFWLAIWRTKKLGSKEKGRVQGRLLSSCDGDQTVGGVNLVQVDS